MCNSKLSIIKIRKENGLICIQGTIINNVLQNNMQHEVKLRVHMTSSNNNNIIISVMNYLIN